MSKIAVAAYQNQIKSISVRSDAPIHNENRRYKTPRRERLHSMRSTVTSDAVNLSKRTMDPPNSRVVMPNRNYQVMMLPESPNQPFTLTVKEIIIITIAVVFALTVAIIAVALAIVYHG